MILDNGNGLDIGMLPLSSSLLIVCGFRILGGSLFIIGVSEKVITISQAILLIKLVLRACNLVLPRVDPIQTAGFWLATCRYLRVLVTDGPSASRGPPTHLGLAQQMVFLNKKAHGSKRLVL